MPKDLSTLLRPGMGMKIIPPSDYDYEFENGRLLVWEAPISGEEYALGIDPAEGIGQDYSVCQVIRKGTLKRPDEQVAEFACNFLDPIDFASVIASIGDFYHDQDGERAFCTVECNAPCGDTMVNDLVRRCDYTNQFIWKAYDKYTNTYTNKFGWWTNRSTRPKIIARGIHAFANKDLIVNSPFTLDEMEDFERDHFIAKAKARSGTHDDRIMALLIGYWGAHDDEWFAGEDIAEERRAHQTVGVLRTEAMAQSAPEHRRVDWQASAITARDMWARANEAFFDE